ncbi:MAG: ribonuclease HII [Melioribacteraceae bacterium]|nr:ribonuclease HII [Melioribacteraceae bacterium]MCF8355054.1 ribonuclease HII [Melioribacteraceae bacterium]MCF8395649.1 ribonuclease HII [Melioribacteraceae bacterium]MCF8420272.1 ribonuclease HII [Melioribacteraceae bacterium]
MNKLKAFDNTFINEGKKYLAGVDEAGRGPLAGPVAAAAVIFDPNTFIEGVNDSKTLPEKKREILFDLIIDKALAYGITVIDQNVIDEINILQASLMAMKLSVDKLVIKPDHVLIDGNKSFVSNYSTQTIVRGDSKSFAISAASILAKVTRDRIMIKASADYPVYFWHKNKGYATRQHIDAILEHGITGWHRKTFLNKIYARERQQVIF